MIIRHLFDQLIIKAIKMCPVWSLSLASQALRPTKHRNLVLITDMEPDDRIALAIVAVRMSERVLAIGTTVLNAARKAALARHALAETELSETEVFVGRGGTRKDYPQMGSTEPALSYVDKEGKDILTEAELDKFLHKEEKGEKEVIINYMQISWKIFS